ncbi:MAG: shikimate kinase [Candidatus Dadabacteria bacterium]|nr:MAG: shikimate kinase [Candidatus Dadabacteria bacterium]
MPAAGKSTIGVVLAKRSRRRFVDTDLLLQERAGRPLQQILSEEGIEAFRRLEEQCVLSLDCRQTVVATGGSVVYSSRAVGHLARGGVLVYLHVPVEELVARIPDMDTRGMVRRPGQSFEDLYAERLPLYRRAADVEVDCSGMSPVETVAAVERALSKATLGRRLELEP